MIRGSVSKGWLHAEGGFVFEESYYFDPFARRKLDDEIEAFLIRRFRDLPVFNMESNLVQREYMPAKSLQVGGIQPNLILGAMLGAEFVFPKGNDGDIKGTPLSGISDPQELPDPEKLMRHPLVERFEAQIEELRKRHPDCFIIPPFFWDSSGRATIHGFITTAFKFVGDGLFMYMFENPVLVKAINSWIFNMYCRLIDRFSQCASLPISGVHIGECSGSMISASDFGRFITPYVNSMGDKYRNIRFHSCGRSDHLIDEMRTFRNLRSLDTGSNTSVSLIRSRLGRNVLIELAPPVEFMLKGSDKNLIREWIAKVLEENDAGPLKIGYHLEPGYDLDTIFALHEELIQRGLTEPGRQQLQP